jgi:menaquinone-specific isochorismate synthase
MAFVCETRPLAADVDLNHVAGGDGLLFVRDGVGLAARGEVARVPVADVPSFLAGVTTSDHVGQPGCGPVAVGSIPFLPGGPAALVVPALVVGKGPDGHRWVTRIREQVGFGTSGGTAFTDDDFAVHQQPAPAPATASYTITQGVPVEHYLAAVTAARDAVRRGDLAKAVIARDVVVCCDRPIDVHAVLLRLRASFGSSYRYSVDGLIGASPELLVARHGDIVRSHPLAGTTARTGDPGVDARLAAELIASVKNQVEHRVVIDEVHDTLLPWCSYLDWQPEPTIVPVANVQHLGTLVEGRLSHPPANVLDLALALSPTPALGGHPREAALALIAAHEGMERGPYGGTVGWVDRHGQGTWAVAIRCAHLSDDRSSARLMAGGGIVGDSDPLLELSETQAKLQAMLSALVRP